MYRRHIARRIIVILDDGSIDGTLAEVCKDGLVLEHASWIPDDGGEPRVMDGIILVPYGSFDFAQVV